MTPTATATRTATATATPTRTATATPTRTPTATPNTASGEFSGDALSLTPYREQLTPNEVRHLLCKYALCGTPQLYAIGIQYGRTALVNALLNYDTEPLLTNERAEIQNRLGGQSVDDFALASAYELRTPFPCGPNSSHSWSSDTARTYWLAHLLNGDPLRENIALHLHHHMPINFDVNINGGIGGGCSSGWTYKAYIDLLRMHALGRAAQTPQERPITSSFKVLLTDMLQDYQMGLYLNNIQPWIIVPSPGYNYWHVGFHNSNFARELLQVFSLGQFNVYDGHRNYSENDVHSVAEALAGNINEFGRLSQVPLLQQTPWMLNPAIDDGRWLEWNSGFRQVGTKTIFENEATPVRKTGDLTPPDVIDSISKHSGFAYVPRMLFNRSVYPLASVLPPIQGEDGDYQDLLQNLDSNFRGNDFRIKNFYQTLMNSSASFSSRARWGCISNGSLHLLRLIRTLQLPVTTLHSPATYDWSTFGQLLSISMPSMNDVIGAAPSIFGYNECGDTDGTPEQANYGQGQLTTQALLGRFNMPFDLMKYYQEGNLWYADVKVPQEGFTIDQLLPPGNPNPTAAQLLSHFENLFGVTLGTQERSIVMNFLDPPSGARPRWSASAALPGNAARPNPPARSILIARTSLLVTIFSNLPDTNIR
ncbi:MAG: DUF1800 family protein [Deltaproteobacteria bacterium]|nr:DUF1800 family protein [Deltaproteobacteria bacterium]